LHTEFVERPTGSISTFCLKNARIQPINHHHSPG
jgi:hypothetical protein